MVLTVSSALSRVTGLSCHPRLADHPARLDASVGASGPHDFAVRLTRPSSKTHPRPSLPAPNVRDDRDTPLQGVRDSGHRHVIWCQKKAEYFFRPGWTGRIIPRSLQKIALSRERITTVSALDCARSVAALVRAWFLSSPHIALTGPVDRDASSRLTAISPLGVLARMGKRSPHKATCPRIASGHPPRTHHVCHLFDFSR